MMRNNASWRVALAASELNFGHALVHDFIKILMADGIIESLVPAFEHEVQIQALRIFRGPLAHVFTTPSAKAVAQNRWAHLPRNRPSAAYDFCLCLL